MTNQQSAARMKYLEKLARRNVISQIESKELDALTHIFDTAYKAQVAHSIFDLPICKKMWEADKKDLTKT